MKTQIYKTLENDIKIVEYNETLAKSLANMWNESREFWSGDPTVYTEEMIKSEVGKSGCTNAYVAITNDDDAIGFCSFGPSQNDDDSFYVQLLGVRPDYHGKGIGKALLNMVIDRAIELKKARVDLYTWAGNTEAMPLYKRMGFFWEEHKYTHLTNFIPFVTTHHMFASFFKGESWYKLSNRAIDTKLCGVKVNTFEMFEYSFKKGDETLKIGFERRGKRVRMVETNDYRIEFLAKQHKLAFGLSYPATFTIENKSGNPLDVNVRGKNDENIAFDYQFSGQIEGTVKHETTFFVGEVKELHAEEKVHPSVLADVTINGETIEFGLGISTKFPLENEFVKATQLSRVGAKEKVYVNIKNLLLEDATVSFTLPQNGCVEFLQSDVTLDVPAGSYGSVCLDAKILNHGHTALPISYNITPKSGESFVYEKELHVEIQGFSAKYYYENDQKYVMANGPWTLYINKNDNYVGVQHLVHGGRGELIDPELGKPYACEFEGIKPTLVTAHEVGNDMVLTYEKSSKAFEGIVLTQVYTLASTGRVLHKILVKNTNTETKNMMLKVPYYFHFLGPQSVFSKRNKLTTNHGSTLYGAEAVEEKDFTENWIFDRQTRSGICWPKDFSADMTNGGYFELEKDLGAIEPGGIYETGEMEFIYGIFEHFSQFRDYVLEKYNAKMPHPNHVIDLQTPTGNPFVYNAANFGLDIINNRNRILKGRFALSSPDGLFMEQVQENIKDEVIRKYSFNIPRPKGRNNGICRLSLDFNLEGSEFVKKKAIFLPEGSVRCSEEDGVLTVDNGQIAFKADAAYFDGLFSLLYLDEGEQREWLMHKHPEHVPNGYWNPFFGGIQFRPSELKENMVLKEQITAEFVEMKDNFDNLWTGFKVAVDVKECEDAKGIRYENYFVTLPGLPVLCYFSKVYNNTGAFKNLAFHTECFPSGSENLAENKLSYTGVGHAKHLVHMGVVNQDDAYTSPLVTLSSTRHEKLHIYRDRNSAFSSNILLGTNEFIQLYKYYRTKLAHGDVHTTSPMFMVLSKNVLVEEELVGLEKIVFE